MSASLSAVTWRPGTEKQKKEREDKDTSTEAATVNMKMGGWITWDDKRNTESVCARNLMYATVQQRRPTSFARRAAAACENKRQPQ
jgi:hypothetical protein